MVTRDFASLRADIRRELTSLQRLEGEAQQLVARVPERPTFVEIRTAGSLLHDFYTGAERIFQRIALELEGGLPCKCEGKSKGGGLSPAAPALIDADHDIRGFDDGIGRHPLLQLQVLHSFIRD